MAAGGGDGVQVGLEVEGGHLQPQGDVELGQRAQRERVTHRQLDADDARAVVALDLADGRGQQLRVRAGAHDDGHRQRLARLEQAGGARRVGGAQQQRPDEVGVRGVAVTPVLPDGLRERGVAGWEDRRVVDQSGQERARG